MDGAGVDVGDFGEEVVECAAVVEEGVDADELALGIGVGGGGGMDMGGVVDGGSELVRALA